MGPIKHFDHVGITVSDLDAALGFFTTLGLEPRVGSTSRVTSSKP